MNEPNRPLETNANSSRLLMVPVDIKMKSTIFPFSSYKNKTVFIYSFIQYGFINEPYRQTFLLISITQP